MQLAGYEVRQGKHLSFRAPEQKNFTYMKSLGSYYSEENVRIRLAKNRSKVKAPKHLSREARLYINISTYVTTGNREGFERWAKLNNLKEAARTFNYLSEKNLLNYEDFKQHVSDVDACTTHIRLVVFRHFCSPFSAGRSHYTTFFECV